MDVSAGRPFYITIVNFGKDDAHLPKYQKVDEATNAPVKIFHIKDEH